MSRSKTIHPASAPPEGSANDYERFKSVVIHRSMIRNAPYNPRKISPAARKQLQTSLETVGLIQPLIWNRRTGNLVGGHQRMTILDSLIATKDYKLTVAEVDLDSPTEKIQVVALNNQALQGYFDAEMMGSMLRDPEFQEAGGIEAAGFTPFDWEMEFGFRPEVLSGQDTNLQDTREPVTSGMSREDSEDGESEEDSSEGDSEASGGTSGSGLMDGGVSPLSPDLKDSAEALKARRDAYQEKAGNDPVNQNNYFIVVCFDDDNDRIKFMEHNSLPVESKYIGAADLLMLLNEGAQWR